MIVLDTNVISELMRPRPSPVVLDWFDRSVPTELYLSAITEAELRRGVALLPDGARKTRLGEALATMIREDFADRVLSFDSEAAVAFAAIFVERSRAGRPISFPDCQIAAIARAKRARIATRNVDDFRGCGVEVLDPWDAGNTKQN